MSVILRRFDCGPTQHDLAHFLPFTKGEMSVRTEGVKRRKVSFISQNRIVSKANFLKVKRRKVSFISCHHKARQSPQPIGFSTEFTQRRNRAIARLERHPLGLI